MAKGRKKNTKRSKKKNGAKGNRDSIDIADADPPLSNAKVAARTTLKKGAANNAKEEAPIHYTVNDREARAALRLLRSKEGKIMNFKRLQKKLPLFALDLKNEKCKPFHLTRTLVWRIFLDALDKREGAYDAGFLEDRGPLALLVARAWPTAGDTGGESGFDMTALAPDEKKLFIEVVDDMIHRSDEDFVINWILEEISEKCATDQTKNDDDSLERLTPYLTDVERKDFQATLIKFQNRIDQIYFNRKRGFFRNKCPLFGLSDDAWSDTLIDVFDITGEKEDVAIKELCKAKEMSEDLEIAAKGVCEGFHEVCSCCWECGYSPTKNRLMFCSGCEAVGYCSPRCQLSSWKGGHKKCCKDIASRNKLLMEALDFVDSVSAKGEIHGIHVDPKIAFSVASHFADPHLKEPWLRELGVEGPKMEYFYHNLAAIHRKEWWIFATDYSDVSSSELSDDEFERMYPNFSQVADKLENDFRRCAYRLLCFDLEGYIKAKVGIVGSMQHQDGKLCGEKRADVTNDMQEAKVDSAAMEALIPPYAQIWRAVDHPYGWEFESELVTEKLVLGAPRKLNSKQLRWGRAEANWSARLRYHKPSHRRGGLPFLRCIERLGKKSK